MSPYSKRIHRLFPCIFWALERIFYVKFVYQFIMFDNNKSREINKGFFERKYDFPVCTCVGSIRIRTVKKIKVFHRVLMFCRNKYE